MATEAQKSSYAESNQIVDNCLEMMEDIDKSSWNERQKEAYRKAYINLFDLGAVLEEASNDM